MPSVLNIRAPARAAAFFFYSLYFLSAKMAFNMDDAILDCIFDPAFQANPMARLYTPIGAPTLDKDGVAHEPTPEEQDAQKKEIAAVALANQEKYDEAFAALTAIIDSVPTYGSAYNNRAQVLRLLKREDEAMNDLNKAIELSGGKGKVAENAFMQRGALHRLARKDDEARADFQAAAAMGNIMAKSELVTLNPYAAMCNQMMTEVLAKAKSGAN